MTDKQELSASSVLDFDDSDLRELYVPFWKQSIYIKQLSGNEMEQYGEFVKENAVNGGKKNMVRMIMLAACKADGSALFPKDKEELLGNKSFKAIQFVFTAIDALNFSDVEQEAKNS